MYKPVLKDNYTIEDLLKIMEALRSENGCPWDKVQTHESIKQSMIEESYEAIDALNAKNYDLFANELGDVLLQVVFHSQIAKENGIFDFDRVLYEICTKLITRHSHVFGDDSASDADDALSTWDKNKKKESGDVASGQILDEVPHHLPSLLRAEKVQKKAVSFGASTGTPAEEASEISDIISNIEKEISENKTPADLYKELLFKTVNLGRLMKLSPETELSDKTNDFIRTFQNNEKHNLCNETKI